MGGKRGGEGGKKGNSAKTFGSLNILAAWYEIPSNFARFEGRGESARIAPINYFNPARVSRNPA